MTPAIDRGVDRRLDRLRQSLAERERLIVVFSGGVDSALLAAVASDVLGSAALAVTAVSPSLAPDERSAARSFATDHDIRHLEVCTDEGDRPEYRANDGDRCYHCRTALFDALDPLVELLDAPVALGTITDDLGDHRPGLRAAAERSVLAPLVDAGFDKAAVREASARLGLTLAEKPASACLASRVAYGDEVTPAVLARIARAEAALHGLGFDELRVRSHGDGTLARIEVPEVDLPRALADRIDLTAAVTRAGFDFVTIDLAGLRSGSMNVLLRSRAPAPTDERGSGAPGDLGYATLDLDREDRQGVAEVVYAPGKTAAEVTGIVGRLLEEATGPVLVSRVDEATAETVLSAHPGGELDDAGRMLAWRSRPALPFRLAVVTAGTSDGPVAAEASATARAIGLQVDQYRDVGVAGLHRILAVEDELKRADAIVVVAGMEGALASVVGGMAGAPVIAVPTSTGYGSSFEGVTALLAMLNSCAAGVSVVNIDNGFGAAMAAYRLARTAGRAP